MSIDKFGQLARGSGAVRGPPGDGFKLTNEGNYDILNKRLTNLADPIDKGDSVNLKSLGEKCLFFKDDGTVDVKDRNLTNVKFPVTDGDAVNKIYVDSVTPVKGNNNWGFGKRRLSQVSDPIDESDVVTKKYLISYTPKKVKDGYHFNNERLKGVKNPVEPQDVVTNGYLSMTISELRKSWFPKRTSENGWDFGGKKLTNVNDPTEPHDVVTKGYFDDERYRLLEDLNDHTQTSGTLLATLVDQIKTIHENLNSKEEKMNLNKKIAEKQIRKFGQLIFPYIRGSQGRSDTTYLTPDNFINWEEVYSEV